LTYRDQDGNECTLHALCRKEPEWAASIVEQLKNENARLRGLLSNIVGTLQYADFTLTGERVFSELDVYLDQARDALKVSESKETPVQP